MRPPLLPLGLVLSALAVLASPASGQGEDRVRASLVRVSSTLRYPNPARPWSRQNAVEAVGTGVVLDGERILTNAHLVLYSSQVYVQGDDEGDRVEATVEAIGPEIDLAVLRVEDEEFFAKHPPLPRGPAVPEPMAQVTAYGYPVGGVGLSVTRGIVSRVEFGGYVGGGSGLRGQIDAAINPGNSGGPALVDGKMVGLVFANLGDAENVGYMIPNREIDAFLADVADRKYDGKPQLRVSFQGIENEALRGKLGLARGVSGVMVRDTGREDADYPLREYDVVTRIGDAAIDNEGMVRLDGNLRVLFFDLVSRLAEDGTVPLTVVRGGETLEIEVPVKAGGDELIPPYRGQMPPYFIYGPLVLTPAYREAASLYLRANPALIGQGSPLLGLARERRREEGRELVVVAAPMFPHRVTKGYGEPLGQVVAEVNGVAVKNLRHLVELLRDGEDPYVVLRFAEQGVEDLVFRRADIEPATAEILEENGIPRRGSEELLAVWNRRAGE